MDKGQADLMEWGLFGIKAIAVIWLISNTRNVMRIVREAFGVIDKAELLGMIFTPVMIWMLWSEHSRDHEWQIFSSEKFLIVAMIVMYGFGLKFIIKAILGSKNVNVFENDKKPINANPSGDGINPVTPAKPAVLGEEADGEESQNRKP